MIDFSLSLVGYWLCQIWLMDSQYVGNQLLALSISLNTFIPIFLTLSTYITTVWRM